MNQGLALSRSVVFVEEDGLRDAQESRGLEDVYKRQDGMRAMVVPGFGLVRTHAEEDNLADIFKAVPYTKGNLQTIYPEKTNTVNGAPTNTSSPSSFTPHNKLSRVSYFTPYLHLLLTVPPSYRLS